MGKRLRKGWKGCMVQVHCPDPPAVSLENLDVLEWEERIETANVDSLFLTCKDHWGTCLYETRVGHMHPGLTFDFIGEMSQTLRSSRTEFIAYYSLGLDTFAVSQHPEWGMRDARDRLMRVEDAGVEKWHRCCTMTGYMEYVLAQLEEILENYEPDGLFLDAFLHPLCYCDDCQRGFREKYGFPIPRRRQDVKKYLRQCDDFKNHVVDEKAIADVKSLLKKVHPDCWFSVSDSWRMSSSLRELVDYHFASPRAFFDEETQFAHSIAADHGLQIFVQSPSQANDFGFQGTKPHRVAKVVAKGMAPILSSPSMGPDGSLDRTEFERAGRIYEEVDEYQKAIGRTRPLNCAGVLYDERTRSALPDTRPYDRVIEALTFLNLTEIPVDVIQGEELSPMKLSPYQLIVLPNVCFISADTAKALHSFVKRGGAILATENTGLYGKDGLSKNEFALADIFGCEYCGTNLEFASNPHGSFLELDVHDIWEGLSLFQEPHTPEGGYIRLRLTTGAAPATHILPSIPLTSSTWVGWGPPPASTLTADPAVVANELGKGRCIYVGFNLFDRSLTWPRTVANAFVDWLLPEPVIRLKTPCPGLIYATFGKRKNHLVVHLVNELGETLGHHGMGVTGCSLTVPKSYCRVTSARELYPRTGKLTVRQTKEAAHLSLPKVHSHMVVELSVR